MKKISCLKLISFLLVSAMITSCGIDEHKPDPNTKTLNVSNKVIDFTTGGNDDFFASTGYGNGTPFNVEWNSKNAVVENNELHLKINSAPSSASYPYYGGEYRSKAFFGYGDFGVRMKPAKTAGTASTFYTYTGEWDSEDLHPSTGANETRNPNNPQGIHDEIDIEFLGKDTTKVQFNYFTNGQGGHEYMYDLGFDASLEYHDYGYRWEKDRITWFVDGTAVYTATDNIPSHPQRMLVNYWAGDLAGSFWMGSYNGEKAQDAVYQWFSADAEQSETHYVPEIPDTPVGPGLDWSKIDPVDMTILENDPDYIIEIDESGKIVDISYNEVQGQSYKNIIFDIPEDKVSSRKLAFEVENKGSETVALRADVNAATTHGENNITAVNTNATQDGAPVATDTSWGGSSFSVAPGQKSLCVIDYNDDPANLMFMIDSHVWQDSATHQGHIVISNLKFSDGQSGQTGDAVTLNFSGNGYECYASDGVSTIKYSSVSDNTYVNVSAPLAGLIPEGANTLEMDFENLGDEKVQINVNIAVGDTSYCVQRSDVAYDWFDEGQSRVQYNIDAHSTRTLRFAFDGSQPIDNILMFVNSSWAQETVEHTNGHMEIKAVTFSVV